MLSHKTTYTIEILCGYAEWWRYNVYIMAIGYDRDGNRVSFDHLTDHVYELDHDGAGRTAPEGFGTGREIKFTTAPCDYVEIYLYAVTNTFPRSVAISDSPPFTLTLRVTADGKTAGSKDFDVNQWGGLTVVAYRVDASA